MAFDYSKKLTNPVDYPTVPQDEQHARQQFMDLFDEIRDEHNNLVDAVDNLSSDAEDINYDNSQSGLTADNVQTAIDEHLADIATQTELGHIKVDGTSITIDENGIISSDNKIIYGYQIDESNSNPLTSVTYIDGAIGMTPATAGDGVSADWNNVYPYNKIRPVLFKNGEVIKELNKNDYSRDVNGNAVDITSGDAGDVMIEFPLIYWKMKKISNNVSVRMSRCQINEDYKPLAHTVGNQIKDKIYIGAYNGSELNGKLRSLSGKAPKGNITIGAMRTLAQANGTGYQQLTYYQVLMLQHLFLLRFKNRDSQTALGRGFVDGNSAIVNTGGTDKKGMYYGETTGKLQLKCFGLEDMWGNIRDWVDGFFSNATRNMLISDQSVFNDNGSGYTDFGQGAGANVSGYMTAIQGGTETGFVTKVGGGSETTHYCDSGALHASRISYFGGGCSTADDAGTFSLNVNNSAAAAYTYIGGRLVFLG